MPKTVEFLQQIQTRQDAGLNATSEARVRAHTVALLLFQYTLLYPGISL